MFSIIFDYIYNFCFTFAPENKITTIKKHHNSMKKLFIAAALFIAALSGVSAQDNNKSNNVTREGKTFVAQSSAKKSKGENIKTEYCYTDTDKNTYPIYISANGRAFIIRTAKKSGKEYRKYLGEEISRQICKELGREYAELNR